jgi:hypothetical protein
MKRWLSGLLLLAPLAGCARQEAVYSGGEYLQTYQDFHKVGTLPPSFGPNTVASSPAFVIISDPDTGHPMLGVGVDAEEDGFVELYLSIPMDKVCIEVIPEEDCSEGRRIALHWRPDFYRRGSYTLDELMGGLDQARLTCEHADLPKEWSKLSPEEWPIPPCSAP